MSPLDDELRTALSSRTASFAPSPDFFAGVERRATRLRRQRVAATVAGSALAVSALGLGGPMLASSLTSTAPGPSDLATSAPTVVADRYALDPEAPWAYRGLPLDELGTGFVETAQREWQVRHPGSDLVPLFGQVHEPSGRAELVFLGRGDADTADGLRWGVVTDGEAGPEFVVDDAYTPAQRFALAAALPGDEVHRLLVVAAPGTTVEYARAEQPLAPSTVLADGVGVAALDGGTDGDSYGVRAPDGSLVTQLGAPDPPVSEGEPGGPATEEPVDADTSAYVLDLDTPWAYRGPAELTLHPDLGAQDERLFAERGSGRSDGSWSQRPLLGLQDEASGLSLLMVLHRSGDEAFVTTTWQTQDEAPRQSEQPVVDGQLLVQTVLPDVGPAGVLIALASPQAGAVETDVAPTPGPRGVTTGVLSVELPTDPPPGSVFLYTEGDGVLYHSEPARRS